ncbi:NADAR family protein [Amycolatopsis samaneae]|uniref:NADAR family protein n=1 Tax=Amycolatopsis samaneae TaxID=664691 RepID=A0ABW5GE70_9PSEU
MSEPIRTVGELVGAIAAGRRCKFLYFWGHTPPRGGGPGPWWLSQWWPAPFTVDGARFATAEHYMMWRKAMLFEDHAMAAKVLTAVHPKQAKDFGRSVRGFDHAAWEAARFDVVVAGNVAKFAQHEELGDFLRRTGSRILVEASPVDRVWGIGLAADDPRSANPRSWRGLNLLGFALGQAREHLARSGRDA